MPIHAPPFVIAFFPLGGSRTVCDLAKRIVSVLVTRVFTVALNHFVGNNEPRVTVRVRLGRACLLPRLQRREHAGILQSMVNTLTSTVLCVVGDLRHFGFFPFRTATGGGWSTLRPDVHTQWHITVTDRFVGMCSWRTGCLPFRSATGGGNLIPAVHTTGAATVTLFLRLKPTSHHPGWRWGRRWRWRPRVIVTDEVDDGHQKGGWSRDRNANCRKTALDALQFSLMERQNAPSGVNERL